MLTLSGTETLLFPGHWEVPALPKRCLRLAYARLGIKYKKVVAQRGFRRPDDPVNSEKDSQILLGL